MNEGYYTVRFKVQTVDGERVVIHAECNCPSGEGWPDTEEEPSQGANCKHGASLFFYINEHEWPKSKTDEKNTWIEPSQKKLALYPQGETYADNIKNSRGFKRDYSVIDQEAVLKIKRLMEKHFADDLDQRPLYKMITANKESTEFIPPNDDLPAVHDLVKEMVLKPLPNEIPTEEINKALQQLQTNPNVLEYFNNRVALNNHGSLDVFTNSRKQGLSTRWQKERDSRLNSSTALKIFKALFGGLRTEEAFLNTMWTYWKGYVPPVSAVVHGRNCEEKAVDKFISLHPELTVVLSGKSLNWQC